MDIVKVASAFNINASWIDHPLTPFELKKNGERAIIVMALDPLSATSWFLLARDLTKAGVRSVFYGTAEGKLNRRYIAPWMNEVKYVAVSNYVKEKLLESGLNVIDVVHHGIDIKSVLSIKKANMTNEKYLESKGLDPRKHFIVLTIANAHPRKGLAWYNHVIEIVEKKDPSIKFLVLTEEKGLDYFSKHQNLVVAPDFGKLPRLSLLSLINSVHVIAMPSLSEGFGLPALEAMALGTPVVHGALPPLMEFSTGFSVPIKSISYFDREAAGPSGIIYEQHLYDVKEFAEVLLQLIDLWRNKRKAIIDWRAKSWEKAIKFDIYKTYPKLLRLIIPILEERDEEEIEPYDFTQLPPIPSLNESVLPSIKIETETSKTEKQTEETETLSETEMEGDHEGEQLSEIPEEIDEEKIAEEILNHVTKTVGEGKLTKPLQWQGGDWWIKDEIIDLLSKSGCKTLVEVFGGSGVISMYAPREVFKVIIYNDKDSLLTNFFKILKERPKDLQNRLVLLPVSRALAEKYAKMMKRGEVDNLDPLTQAVILFYANRLTQFGNFSTFGVVPSRSCATTFRRQVTLITEYAKMWSDIAIENLDFRRVFELYDRDYTVFYCDPPFLPMKSANRDDYYRLTFTESDMKDLLTILSKIKGKFVLKLPEDHLSLPFIGEWIEKNGFNVKTIEHSLSLYKVIGEERPKFKTVLVYNYKA
jgi:DNA adenine methylase